MRIIFILLLSVLASCGKDDDCDVPKCGIDINGNVAVAVTGSVSGFQGTQITPDEIIADNITENSAVVKFTVVKIGRCHKVLGYGHAWSSFNATPTIGVDNFSDYEENINFNDEVATLMPNLNSGTKYFVRSWVAIEKQNCLRERVVFYNDEITIFETD